MSQATMFSLSNVSFVLQNTSTANNATSFTALIVPRGITWTQTVRSVNHVMSVTLVVSNVFLRLGAPDV